jgi:septal ring factor EnvC (AmiA/AmiB activator)
VNTVSVDISIDAIKDIIRSLEMELSNLETKIESTRDEILKIQKALLEVRAQIEKSKQTL